MHSGHCLPSSTGLRPDSDQHMFVVDHSSQQWLLFRGQVSHNLCSTSGPTVESHPGLRVYTIISCRSRSCGTPYTSGSLTSYGNLGTASLQSGRGLTGIERRADSCGSLSSGDISRSCIGFPDSSCCWPVVTQLSQEQEQGVNCCST